MTDIDLQTLVEGYEPPEATPEVLTPTHLGKLPLSTVGETAITFNILIYGDSGVGKTVLSASAADVPEMNPVLFIDIEGGTSSIRYMYPNMSVLRVTTWDQMQQAYDFLFEGEHDFKTIIIDSLTEIQQFSMYGIMKELIVEDPGRDPDVPGIREWGKNAVQTNKFVRAFRDLPYNVIFTALRMEDKDPRSKINLSQPQMTGKATRQVPAYLDQVSYYYIRQVDGEFKRLLLNTPTEKIVAKDRSDNLPAVIMEPTMQTIYDYVTYKTKRNSSASPTPQETNEDGSEA